MSNAYPTTETFLVNWLGGTSGAFITMLIYNILFPSNEIEISPSNNGAAHTNQNIIPNTLYRFNNNFDGNYEHPYRYIDPKISKNPLILYDHVEPEFKEYFDKFPLGKTIVIRFNEKMVPLLHGNFFFKNTINLSAGNETWQRLIRENEVLCEYDSPRDLPDEVINQLLKKMSNNYTIEHYYSEQYIPPEEYNDRIYFIDFYDIIFNKTKVLTQLSNITNRPINDFVNNQYDIYLEKQKELMNTKLSWIDLA